MARKAAYAVRASVRVNGVTYRSPDEAFVAADAVEHDAQQRADQYRRNGDEGLADRTVDRGREQAETLRTWARQREEFEAHEAEQPADVELDVGAPSPNGSTAPRSPSRPKRPARRKPSGRAASRRFGGSTGRVARRGYARSGAQAQVRAAGTLGWEIAGATIGLALLTLFLSKRGAQAFADLTTAAATALRVVVDPVDPLQPGLLDTYVAQAQASTMPAVPQQQRAPTSSSSTLLARRRVPATRRTSSRPGALV